MAQGQLRLGRYRRHVHRCRRVRRSHRQAAPRQEPVDADRIWLRASITASPKPAALSSARAFPSRLDHRHQHAAGAHRRQDRAAHHQGLSRHLRDRPRQSAGLLQSVLQEACAADRAGAALRGDASASSPTARSHADRRRRDRRAGQRLEQLGIAAVAIMFLHCYRNPDHERARERDLGEQSPDMFVSASHELTQEYREFERCSTVAANAYIGPRVRAYIGEIDAHMRKAGFNGSFLVVQSTGGPLRSRAGARPLRAHAGIGSGRRRHRHAGAVPRARHRQCDRLRHGRYHGESRRHLSRRGADHRRGADRRLRTRRCRCRSP